MSALADGMLIAAIAATGNARAGSIAKRRILDIIIPLGCSDLRVCVTSRVMLTEIKLPLKLAGPGKEMQAFEKQGNSVFSSSAQTAAGVSRFPASILAAFCRNGRLPIAAPQRDSA
jgi:hypothetical protein